jgi:prepilin-type N-terminal cleavage/methylation domain-containing protein
MPGHGTTENRTAGFTLIELMVVIAILMVLAGLILGGVSVMRRRASTYESEQVVRQLRQALEAYRTEDGRHRYPLHEQLYPTPTLPLPHLFALTPQDSAVAGILGQLIDRNLGVRDSQGLTNGLLLDPWGSPYRYQLTRPAPANNAARLVDWNWDTAAARPMAWNAVANSAGPYPYIWSTGRMGRLDDAQEWIYDSETR